MIRVLLADDHPVMRKGLRALLADVANMEVVGEAASGDEAQVLCTHLRPDVLLLDLSMPGPSAADTVRYLRAQKVPTHIVILTAYRDDVAVQELVRLGVDGYALKDDEPGMVVQAIARVARDGTWFSPQIMASLLRDARRSASEPPGVALTSREKDVLELVRKGWENKRIAAELALGEQTVRNYLRTIYAKIGVRSRAEAVVWTHEHAFDRH
jgi:DNA-binding NarL/FixJ family response regulator